MPIEIKELVIRARVETGDKMKKKSDSRRDKGADAQLVEECVEQVLEILRKQKER